MSNNTLKELIHLMVTESSKKILDEVELADGRSVSYGSNEHINDIQMNINNMTRIRKRHKKGSAARENYSRVIARLKNELQKALKKNSLLQNQEGDRINDE